jgi:hypothetical protein
MTKALNDGSGTELFKRRTKPIRIQANTHPSQYSMMKQKNLTEPGNPNYQQNMPFFKTAAPRLSPGLPLFRPVSQAFLLSPGKVAVLRAVSRAVLRTSWGAAIALGMLLPSPATAQTASGIKSKTKAKNTSLWQKVRDNTHLMYWSMFSGPGVGSRLDQTVRVNGAVANPNFFHAVWTGAKLGKRDAVGVQHRVFQEFGSTTADGRLSPGSFNLLSPRLYWRRSGMIDNSLLNMLGEFRWEIPTTESLRARGNIGTAFFIENFQIKTPDKAWFVGLSLFQVGILNNATTPNTLGVALIPNLSYTFNPRWAFYGWAWIDTEITQGTGARSMGAFADADYLRVGPMYSPIPQIQIYPCVQAYFSQPSLDTTTLGLELSATL